MMPIEHKSSSVYIEWRIGQERHGQQHWGWTDKGRTFAHTRPSVLRTGSKRQLHIYTVECDLVILESANGLAMLWVRGRVQD